MYQNLLQHLSKFVEIDEHAVKVLKKYFIPVQLKKKEFLLKEGQQCRSIYFVEKGCLRMFFINGKMNEQITQFALENWWISDFYSFIDNMPSEYSIQAIEKSDVLSIDAESLDALFNQLPQLERYIRIILQKAIASLQLRIKYIYDLSKEEFYTHFCTSFPEFVQRVPQYMIASYLGLSPEYVSELRKK